MLLFNKKTKLDNMRLDCYNLDYSFIEWLNPRLKVYLQDAEQTIDLDFYKFEYNGNTYTQKEIINMMIELCEFLLKNYFVSKEAVDKSKELTYLWHLVFSTMWW